MQGHSTAVLFKWQCGNLYPHCPVVSSHPGRRRRANNTCRKPVHHPCTPPIRGMCGIFAPHPPVSVKACTPLNRGDIQRAGSLSDLDGLPALFFISKKCPAFVGRRGIRKCLSTRSTVPGGLYPCHPVSLGTCSILSRSLIWGRPHRGHDLPRVELGADARNQIPDTKPDLGRRLARHPLYLSLQGVI